MRVKSATDISAAEAERLSQFLKTLDNSVAYGILAELNRQDGEEADVEVFGLETFRCDVEKPEKPGDFLLPDYCNTHSGRGALDVDVGRGGSPKAWGEFCLHGYGQHRNRFLQIRRFDCLPWRCRINSRWQGGTEGPYLARGGEPSEINSRN